MISIGNIPKTARFSFKWTPRFVLISNNSTSIRLHEFDLEYLFLYFSERCIFAKIKRKRLRLFFSNWESEMLSRFLCHCIQLKNWNQEKTKERKRFARCPVKVVFLIRNQTELLNVKAPSLSTSVVWLVSKKMSILFYTLKVFWCSPYGDKCYSTG